MKTKKVILRILFIVFVFSFLLGCSDDDESTSSTTSTTTGGTTTGDTTAPTVSSVSPTDASTSVAKNSSVSVTFSEVMASSSVTTNTSDTSCSGSLQLSSDSFSTCIAMSASPSSSDNTSFSITPAADINSGTTFKFKVTTSATDSAGNALASAYTTSNGFTTVIGNLTGVWSFIDGNAASDGINKDTSKSALYPQLIVFNSKLYSTWRESNGTKNQIRVVEWDGASTWSFVDGNGVNGINKDSGEAADQPHLIAFNSKLYAIWYEDNSSSVRQIRVAEWDGSSTWAFVDGNGTNGINKDTGQTASNPQLTSFNSKLYAIWNERNGSFDQIRIAEWDGSSTWTFVDGNGANGINKNTSKPASRPQLTAFNSKLYAIWLESNAATVQVRVAEWDGSSTWTLVDGNGTDGINKDASKEAGKAQLTAFNSKLYATWRENNGTTLQIRVAEWDGTSTWAFVDGNGSNGLNKDPSKYGEDPQLTVFNSNLYAIWNESNSANREQVRVVKWDGSSSWSFVDGDHATDGINKDPTHYARMSQLTVFSSKLYAMWVELDASSIRQIRAAVAATD